MALNIGLAAVKILSGIVGRSQALIADGIESLADIGGNLIAFGGIRIASQPADHNHPYGHGKAEPLASVLISFLLGGAVIVIAISSVRSLIHPQPLPAPWTLVVLALIFTTKEVLFRFTERRGTDAGSNVLVADAWHHRCDAITSFAAFIGISLSLLFGWRFADAAAAMIAAGIIAVNAHRIGRQALAELMDESPEPALEAKILDVAVGVPNVRGLDKCLVRKMGLEYYVELHLLLDGSLTVHKGHEIAHEVKDAVQNQIAGVADVIVHVEPVIEKHPSENPAPLPK